MLVAYALGPESEFQRMVLPAMHAHIIILNQKPARMPAHIHACIHAHTQDACAEEPLSMLPGL